MNLLFSVPLGNMKKLYVAPKFVIESYSATTPIGPLRKELTIFLSNILNQSHFFLIHFYFNKVLTNQSH